MNMDHDIKVLYQKMKDKKISNDEAAKQIYSMMKQSNENYHSSLYTSKGSHLKWEQNVQEEGDKWLLDRAANYLKQLLSSVMKLPADRIEVDAHIEEYGIDSVMIMELTDELEKIFGSLPKTLFFEYHSIQELANYFLDMHRNQLIKAFETAADVGGIARELETLRGETIEVEQANFKNDHIRINHRFSESLDEEEVGALDIAIIGLAGKYPGAENVEEFWENLRDGKDCITEIPKERWNHDLYFDEEKHKPGKTYSKWGGFLHGVDEFDPLFFNISPLEAERMDPQERLFLECVYETMEDAGYTRSITGSDSNLGIDNNVGVYVGVMYEEYQLYGAQEQMKQNPIALGGNSSSIANRVSYFFNFRGPSIAINTMCSSSLVSIHLACQSLQRGDCNAAIAGGVNISVHPNKYLLLGQGGFVSSKGRCESFGEGADGYVPGEGVGAILLKPLAKAIADGDHIYGVIKGTAVNHGGKTTGYTVPSPNAQAEVIKKALKESGIDPHMVSYIEAHGTGTFLGDPIEIAGLMKAFQDGTKNDRICAIGSAKSNIGHAESAAGIAGVTKILMQFKHHQLAPSLHSKILNKNIDFQNTPFVVQQELADWKRPITEKNGVTKKHPRIAGISSFGAGGTNAHLIIQEYIPKIEKQSYTSITEENPAIVVLSAKNEERLKESVRRLSEFLNVKEFKDDDLASIAYTLQVGRYPMAERLAFTACSINELQEKLLRFLNGESKELYRGCMTQNKEKDDQLKQLVEKSLKYYKYENLLEIWTKGLNFNWKELYHSVKPSRISLPTYPFDKKRYWFPKVDEQVFDMPSKLHPLVHQNTSNLLEQRYSSIFTGQESFLKGHIVGGKRVFSSAACLEMIREAVRQATYGIDNELRITHLKNVIWTQPIFIEDNPVHLHIRIFANKLNELDYEIYSYPEGELDVDPIIHCHGRAVLHKEFVKGPILDVAFLQAECNESILSAKECYDIFKLGNIQHGEEQRYIQSMYVGDGRILTKLSLATSINAIEDDFILHPSLIDSAILGALGLGFSDYATSNSKKTTTITPFALDELEIFDSCTSNMWALICYSNSNKPGDKIEKLNITLCNEEGKVCLKMNGFSIIRKEIVQTDESLQIISSEKNETDLLVYRPVWEAVRLDKSKNFHSPAEHVVIIGGTEGQRDKIKQHCPQVHVLNISDDASINEIMGELDKLDNINHIIWVEQQHLFTCVDPDAIIKGQEQGVLQVFRLIKALISLGYDTRDLVWTVFTVQAQPIHKEDEVKSGHTSIHGLLGSAAKEIPSWKVRLIDLPSHENWPIATIFTIPASLDGNPWVYRNQTWYQQNLIAVHQPYKHPTLYKTGGIYIVIGGAGGIGETWSEYMIRKYQAQLIWIGRRTKNANIQEKLDRLAALGPVPLYISADATDQEALQKAYVEIKQHFSSINGVIHSVVGELDQSLTNMKEERFKAGLASKVDSSVRMAQIFGKEPMDFFMFFSSIGSFGKPSGQSSYAAGCTFTDAFSVKIAKEFSCPVKVMNWGYWGEIGVGSVVPQAFKNRMAQSGIGFIEPAEGMEALETLLSSPIDQLALIKTTNAFATEGTIDREVIKVYPKNIARPISEIGSLMPDRNLQAEKLKRKRNVMMEPLEKIFCKLLFGQLQSCGILANKDKVIDLYHRWFDESMKILIKYNYLEYVDEDVYKEVNKNPIDMDATWSEWQQNKEIWKKDVNLNAQLSLIESTLKALPEILIGKIAATDIIFPNSSMELVEGIYKNNAVSDFFNEVLSDCVAAYVEACLKQNPSLKIRIIEIGAGTGGTSSSVFKKLKPYSSYIEEYCYTDISKAFLMHAEKEYGSENPYLTYKIFDVEKSIEENNINAEYYDIVIAANALHATKNIRQTIRNIKTALKTDGLILLNELSANSLFTHLTFGMLEGWWVYEDEELRISGCPGVSSENWQAIFEHEGLNSVFFPTLKAHELGYQIIGAKSDGIVRAKLKLNEKKGEDKEEVMQSSYRMTKLQSKTISSTNDVLVEKSMNYFKKLVGDALKIPIEQIDPVEPLENYGIDSILVVQMTNTLRKTFNEISSTLFFEHQTIESIVQHLINTEKDALVELIGLRLDSEKLKSCEQTELSQNYSKENSRESRRFLQIEKSEIEEGSSLPIREPIAIIGVSGHYPKANNMRQYWGNLKNGKDCITEIPAERWSLKEFYEENPQKAGRESKSYSKWGGFIEGFANFDPLFFNISPREALSIDPQERLFLQICWELLEDSGYTRNRLSTKFHNRIGVFAGITKTGFDLCGSEGWKRKEGILPHTSFSSVANRVSYLFNLKGPSMPIDTMCSSSLTAIHEACEHLYRQECEMAIAGGVNLYLHPSSYIGLSAQHMLSIEGKCKSFGSSANGFVPGEGVGAILLKPLSKAIRDEDQIYAVIRATSINHGGKTNGYTVPNPNAQGELIRDAIEKAGIDARTVSYIEAHGTGTELGDPIEIRGLTQAFAQDTNDTEYCAIGSVKSNIGHLEAAAGIAGLTKIILQMKYKKQVPSLHSEELNPNIDFSKTPFRVQQKLENWKRPRISINGITKEFPRIAGISSFGAGGANAHILLEEYIPEEQDRPKFTFSPENPALIVLSAKNEQRLTEQVQRLLDEIHEHLNDDCHLADIAYTLQVGREAMEERIALKVSSIIELKEKLKAFVEGQTGIEDLFRGQVKQNKGTIALFADEELQNAVESWIVRRKYTKVLELWVKGLDLNWELLYRDIKPRRISLPTYPFAQDQYWISEDSVDTTDGIVNSVKMEYIHPLLHKNTSDFSEQRFSSAFTGQEFFLADHVVKGERVLPGVAYLEMARTALEHSLSSEQALKTKGIHLKNIVWVRPFIVGEEETTMHISLYPYKDDEVNYEIYSIPQEKGKKPIVHSQGSAVYCKGIDEQSINISEIKEQCIKSFADADQIYQAFKVMGIEYGPRHRGIEMIHIGENQALAKLSLPVSISESEQDFVLHPSMLDAALQAPIAFLLNHDEQKDSLTAKPFLPFALQEVEIFGPCTASMWALIRYNVENGTKETLDIDLADTSGKVCVRLKGYSWRELEDVGGDEILIAETVWKEQEIIEVEAPSYAKHLVILCEPNEPTINSLKECMWKADFLILKSKQKEVEERFQIYAEKVFNELQMIMKKKLTNEVLIQFVISKANQNFFNGLFGLLKSSRMENKKIIVQLIEVESLDSTDKIIFQLEKNSCNWMDTHIQYQNGKRYVEGIRKIDVSLSTQSMPWKDHGIYLITGGAGGLGRIFVQEIVQKVKGATLILTGRSELSEEEEESIQELGTPDSKIIYKQVDVTNKQDMNNLIKTINNDIGTLGGVIHSAGVIRDNVILKKNSNELHSVLGPKVKGTKNLDEATKDIPLDFFILFSSLASVTGNAGQADYAAANAFIDEYAKYRGMLVEKGERHGQTLAVNWPLWSDGGMTISEENKLMIEQTTGMMPIQTSLGIKALYQSFYTKKVQTMVMTGNLMKMKKALFEKSTSSKLKMSSTQDVHKVEVITGLKQQVEEALILVVSNLLMVKLEEIDIQTELSEYGFDSITFTQFSNTLNKEYNFMLTPTVFFQYSNLEALAEYLIEEYQEQLLVAFSDGKNSTVEREQNHLVWNNSNNTDERKDVVLKRHSSRLIKPLEAKGETSQSESIAIVGVSGKFPMSEDIEEFWGNLKQEKDCISEIPKNRWDWEGIYGNPLKEENKTNIKWGGFIDGVDEFDPLFFGISPREAELMDPQQRLLMTYAWKAIEDAGISRETLSGTKTGIFVGTSFSGYSSLISKAKVPVDSYSSTGLVPSVGPNRMSFFLDIHGPSEPIETACSSSLVAIDRAVKAIENGSCEMAIVGGVNSIVTPDGHISFSKAGMLALDGRCKTFSNQANGYVRSEGVGMLFLKKLTDAERDGNHIYGLIRGTAQNHGGHANSLTAPNPKAQTELLTNAYMKAGIDPRTIQYIETHGTGTELGDPIEIDSLKLAFKELYKVTGDASVTDTHCGLGSVKSNIGHTELAAGIAGVIKVLLQIKHKTLIKTLHCDTINPYIQLEGSPFYIVRESREWKAMKDSNGKSIPRRAGVSSFGFGGSNAHVVIEEYIPNVQRVKNSGNPVMIVLSAKNQESLQERAQQLLNWISRQEKKEVNLTEISYTLQVGRESMEERLALIVNSAKELEEKLQGFIDGRENEVDLYLGKAKPVKDFMDEFSSEKRLEDTLEYWIEKKEYEKVLQLWVKGVPVKWREFYKDIKPHLISLPTYPFAKERYWIKEGKGNGMESNRESSYLHPLLHRNISDFHGQRFHSLFTGREFFLSDHLVNGQKVLPGTAYLEMALAGVERALGIKTGENGICIKNIIWAQPIIIENEDVNINLSLHLEKNGDISFEIYSESDAVHNNRIVHSKGTSALCASIKESTRDIKALQAECIEDQLSPDQLYAAFKKLGIEYGPSHRGVQKVYLGQDKVLAKISLPLSVAESQNDFVLHPSILDSALQASLGLLVGSHDIANIASIKPILPFALQEIEILGSCTESMWALLRYSEGSSAYDKVQKIDIDLLDDNGDVRVCLKGYTSRMMESETLMDDLGTLMFVPEWKEKDAGKMEIHDYSERLVIFCENSSTLKNMVEEKMEKTKCLILQSEQGTIEERYEKYTLQLFEEIQWILKQRANDTVLIQFVISAKKEQQLFTGLMGLLKTAHLENPKIIVQMIEMEQVNDADELILKLQENSCNPMDDRIKYQEGRRYTAYWNELKNTEQTEYIPWKDNGIYVITGGAGGLGLIFAKEIAETVKNPTLILIGRSKLSDGTQHMLQVIEDLGAKIIYTEVDVSDKWTVNRCVKNIERTYGALNGIIHSAGITRDNFIINKNKMELQKVFAPKVAGLVNLDEASKDMALDFFIVFSSLAAVNGNIGQADYAASNAFMDAYMKYRTLLKMNGKRYGQSLSINWPLWQDGGMKTSPETEKIMSDHMGISSIQTSSGIRAFYRSLASKASQVLVIEGDMERIQSTMFNQVLDLPFVEKAIYTDGDQENVFVEEDILKEKVLYFLKNLLSSVTKLPVNQIQADAPFEKYGIDSLMVMQLNIQLEELMGSLSKTLFFEYQTLQSLTAYFIESHREKMIEILNIKETEITAEHDLPTVSIGTKQPIKSSMEKNKNEFKSKKEAATLDIAIIGVAGRYPEAENLYEFWDNLKNGKDNVREVPKERWNYNLYYNEDKNSIGKTYSKWGGFIEGVDQFDPLFFNISPREAEIMDPQERLFLQCAWEVLEDAGYTRESIREKQSSTFSSNVGVYVGVMYEEYQLYGAQEQVQGRSVALSGSPSSIANRVSYFFNFNGPSIAVDTMCSSSLTAIHLACSSILRGECKLAIAGGVNISIHPNKYLHLGQGKFLSSKGRCESFGDGGDGYVPGEGVGAILLKPLSEAIADGDQIYGVIKGTAANHGGKTNGYTVPNPQAQSDVIKRSLQEAGIDPRTISYIEAHGTGTTLGDPIEITGLMKTFQEYTEDKQFCAIGSVKSNIGHCESAAGIAGVTKVLLQMKHGHLVPSLHSKRLNTNIDFSKTPFVVQQELAEWRRPKIKMNGVVKEYPRRAGVSAFGAGGSNAHIIIEEYVLDSKYDSETISNPQNQQLIVLSAKNKERLQEQVQRLLDIIQQKQFSDISLSNIAYTLQVGREAMDVRLGIIASTVQELKNKLTSIVKGDEPIYGIYQGQVKRDDEAFSILTTDKEMKEVIEKWRRQGKYGKLLELWVNGLNLHWDKFYEEVKPKRISLPAYPFAKECYWVPTMQRQPDFNSTDQPLGAHIMETDHMYNKEAVIYSEHFESTIQSVKEQLKNKIQPLVMDTVVTKDSNRLLEKVQTVLLQFISKLYDINIKDMDVDTELDEYGLDAVKLVEFINKFNQDYNVELNTSILFDQPTISIISSYLVEQYGDQLIEIFNIELHERESIPLE